MNWGHLKTFFWLRRRLAANQNKRQGLLVKILGYVLWVFLVLGSLAALSAGYILGSMIMTTLRTDQFMYIWDGLVIACLVFWLTGLLGELSRSDILSLDRFLHLPVTPTAAFLINYLTSSASLSVIMTLSIMSGITIGLLVSIGPEMLVLVLLVAGFFLMMTAVTYQFRGWLTSMMTTSKRRQGIIGILSIVVMAFVFLPPLIGMFKDVSKREAAGSRVVSTTGQDAKGDMERVASRMGIRPRSEMAPEDKALVRARIELANAVLPPGWLPLGAVSMLEGRVKPALVTLLGMFLIGTWSLMRSYRTTIRMYKGEFDSRPVPARPNSSLNADTTQGGHGKHASFLETRLPWISEHASAIAMAGLRAKLRTTQMMFVIGVPIILLLTLSVILKNPGNNQSEFIRTLLAAGISAFFLFVSMTYIVGNLFAHDRGGFRVFVLSSATRRDVLLGRNLSMFPIAFSLMLFSILVVNWFQPMHTDHLLAVILQTIPLYLILCMYGNLMSIYMPMVITNAGMPAGGQNVNILIRELTGLLMLPVLSITFIPLGIEYLMSLLDWHTSFPAYLFFMIVETGLVIWVYSIILNSQAEHLYRREQRILEVVTAKVD